MHSPKMAACEKLNLSLELKKSLARGVEIDGSFYFILTISHPYVTQFN